MYLSQVKGIFQKKCFDCHSNTPQIPWYFKVPFVHGLMENDMREAKEHLNFSRDFPFKGHGTPKEDLAAIKESVIKQTMPPRRYLLMHWLSKLTEREVQAVAEWVDESLKLLDAKN